jgi:hypothetical protein
MRIEKQANQREGFSTATFMTKKDGHTLVRLSRFTLPVLF